MLGRFLRLSTITIVVLASSIPQSFGQCTNFAPTTSNPNMLQTPCAAASVYRSQAAGETAVYVDNPDTTGWSVIRLNAGAAANSRGGALQIIGDSQNFGGAAAAGTFSMGNYQFGGLALAAFSTDSRASIRFYTGGYQDTYEKMRLTNSGLLGIGTANPVTHLNLISAANDLGDGVRIGAADWATNGGYVIVNKNSGTGGAATLQSGDSASWAPVLLNPHGGTVAIGELTAGPYTFEVAGTAHITGNVTVDGNIGAKYQDLAEWVPASEAMAAGTVVIIDPASKNGIKPSRTAYDTSVAGVVSPAPGLVLGEPGATKEKIATTGRVKVRVDATKHPVRVGDLLVTSDKSGMAMVSEPIDVAGVKIHRPGTLIGKALEPLAAGEGEVLVLLSLQ